MSQLVTIRVLETYLHDNVRYEYGETRKVSQSLAEYFCGLGWAEDVESGIPKGERVAGAKQLTPDSLKLIAGNGNG